MKAAKAAAAAITERFTWRVNDPLARTAMTMAMVIRLDSILKGPLFAYQNNETDKHPTKAISVIDGSTKVSTFQRCPNPPYSSTTSSNSSYTFTYLVIWVKKLLKSSKHASLGLGCCL